MKSTRKPTPVSYHDEYGYTKITFLADALHGHYESAEKLANTIEELTSAYSIKEDKFALVDSFPIYYTLDKNGRKINRRRYLKTNDILENLVNPVTFRDFVFKRSFFNWIETGIPKVILPTMEEIVPIIFHEICTSFMLAAPFPIKNNGTEFHYLENNQQDVADTWYELNLKKKKFLGEIKTNEEQSIERYYRCHGGELKIYEINRLMDEKWSEYLTISNNKLIYTDTLHDITMLRDSILKLKDRGLFKLRIGGPGVGKSHATLVSLPGNGTTLFVSLSNTVAFSGKTRGAKLGKKIEPMSYTMFKIKNRINQLPKDLNAIVVDELSQSSIGELGMLNDMANLCLEKNIPFYTMGDTCQISSFLNRGSILHSIVSEFPDVVEMLTKNYRVAETSRGIVESANKFRMSHNTAELEAYKITKEKLLAIIEGFDDSASTTTFICGSNAHCILVNCLVMNVLLQGRLMFNPLSLAGSDVSSAMQKVLNDNSFAIQEYLSTHTMRFRSQTTSKFEKVKVFANEEFQVHYDSRNITLTSLLDREKTLSITFNSFAKNFVPAFAITSNKSQGLEWDNVVVVVGNLRDDIKSNYNLQSSFEHLYTSVTRPKNNLYIYFGSTANYQMKPLSFVNIFSYINK